MTAVLETPVTDITPRVPGVEWKWITPNVARAFLAANKGNRGVRRPNVDKLVRDMQAGNFMITGDALRFDTDGRLIDGQHRCYAIAESGIPQLTLVITGLDPRVQTVIDNQAKRTGSDALKMSGQDKNIGVLAAMARLDITRQSGGMQHTGVFMLAAITNSEILDWVEQHPEAAGSANYAKQASKHLNIASSSLAYAHFVLSSIDADAAHEFFQSAVEMRTGGAGDPRLTMIRTFQRDKDNKARVRPGNQLFYIFKSWNAWRAGEQLKRLQTEYNGQPIRIPEPR